jgi:hypothetical protein
MLEKYGIKYFITKARQHLVVKEYIEKFERPYVRLRGFSVKIEVVKEKLREFENWLIAE